MTVNHNYSSMQQRTMASTVAPSSSSFITQYCATLLQGRAERMQVQMDVSAVNSCGQAGERWLPASHPRPATMRKP